MKKLGICIFQFILFMIIGIPNVFAIIQISQDDVALGIGKQLTLKATNNTSNNISWVSSNPNVVSIDNNGVITGVALGTAYIKVTDGNSIDISKVRIIDNYVPVTSITLASTSGTIVLGDVQKIEPTVNPTNASNKKPVYVSSNSNVVSVDKDGYITGKSIGTANISLTIENKVAIYKVTVVSKVNLNNIMTQANLELKLNQSKKLTVTYEPSNATDKTITWQSSEPSVVSVDQNGNLKALSIGSATITVTSHDGNHVATTKVTVVENQTPTTQETPTTTRPTTSDDVSLKNIYLSKSSLSLNVGSTETLNIAFSPENATNKKVTWQSSDTKVATVSDNGKITAVAVGITTITVTSNDGNYTANCKVNVTENGSSNPEPEEDDKTLKSISLDKRRLSLKVGKEAKLTVQYTPEDAVNKKVTWQSSDETIATVKDGIVKALKPGKVEIKAVSEEGNYSVVCIVNIYLDAKAESISFEKERETMYVDSTIDLNLIGTPENTMIDDPIWKSSDESVVTVIDGEVTGLKVGNAIITVSNKDETITASISINVVSKIPDKLIISIDGYDINFDPNVKSYNLKIGKESQLNIKTNYDESRVTINGNRDLKNGSIITVVVTGTTKTTYVFNIKKSEFKIIYLIAIISVFLILNLVRIAIKNKKKNNIDL